MDRDNEETEEPKSPPAVKEINWNFLIAILSTIMVVIGVPSMISACFSDSMGACGVNIFFICASVIAFFMGILYCYSGFIFFKTPLSGCSIKVGCFFIALGIALLPWTIYSWLNDQWGSVLFWTFIAIIIVLLGMGIAVIPQKLSQIKNISKRRLVGLLLVGIGSIILLISMPKTVVLAVIFFGNVCFSLGFIFPISMFLMLLL